jgi:large subunit ribosomal protein L28
MVTKRCQVSEKRRNKANAVSFSNKRNRKFQQPNLQSKRFWDPEQKRWVTLRVSVKVLKTITKYGLRSTLKRYDANTKLLQQ